MQTPGLALVLVLLGAPLSAQSVVRATPARRDFAHERHIRMEFRFLGTGFTVHACNAMRRTANGSH